MPLLDKLRGRLSGTDAETQRRLEILTALLEAFASGGQDAASELLDGKMNELEHRFDEQLAALEAKL
jgi:hypothetical protein